MRKQTDHSGYKLVLAVKQINIIIYVIFVYMFTYGNIAVTLPCVVASR